MVDGSFFSFSGAPCYVYLISSQYSDIIPLDVGSYFQDFMSDWSDKRISIMLHKRSTMSRDEWNQRAEQRWLPTLKPTPAIKELSDLLATGGI